MPTQTIHTDDHGRLLAKIDLDPKTPAEEDGIRQYAVNVASSDVFLDVDEPNVVSSRTLAGTHKPIFDLDFPCRLIESSTPGKFHLYLDGIELTEEQYSRVVNALEYAGIVQRGWAQHLWMGAKATFLRLPHVKKSQKQIEREAAQAKKAEFDPFVRF